MSTIKSLKTGHAVTNDSKRRGGRKENVFKPIHSHDGIELLTKKEEDEGVVNIDVCEPNAPDCFPNKGCEPNRPCPPNWSR